MKSEHSRTVGGLIFAFALGAVICFAVTNAIGLHSNHCKLLVAVGETHYANCYDTRKDVLYDIKAKIGETKGES